MESTPVPGGWLLRLVAGEKLPDAVAGFCERMGIQAATCEGLGALADVTLGYFDLERKTYDRTHLPGSWELLSLFCDVAEWEGKLFAHTHVVLSGPDFVARGGHLFEGTVSVTAELRLWTIDRSIRRRHDAVFDLHFLDLGEA